MKSIRLRPGKEKSLLRRHPWVFDSAIAKGGGDPGETVRVEAHDGSFLAWAAEPTLEARHRMGFKVILFLVIATGIFYAAKRKIWSRIQH